MYYINKLKEDITKAEIADDIKTSLLQTVESLEREERRKQEEALKDSSVEYWATVNAIAKEALDECGDDESEAYDYIHQDVGGSSWIIYTYTQIKVIQYSDNEDAYSEIGELPNTWSEALSCVAFCAMKADVMTAYRELLAEKEDAEDDEE